MTGRKWSEEMEDLESKFSSLFLNISPPEVIFLIEIKLK